MGAAAFQYPAVATGSCHHGPRPSQVGYMGPRYVDRARFRASLLNMMEDAEYAEAYVQYFAYEGDGFPR
ncbi:MAG: hypothetical protein OXG60_13840 [Chloroflexi bacterium]|nr:hypothetical protein [Chloroflexota bacterium]